VQAGTADQLSTVLGELKGGAMKVGQWMSAMEAALPEQLAGPYGEALTRLQEAAPAMPMRTVDRVLTEAFDRSGADSSRTSTRHRRPRRALARCTAASGTTAGRSR
jgi:predicted unusual protein kinase regulating ubiquinone biosynthesis (AarF/ABC1/UbiB family)